MEGEAVRESAVHAELPTKALVVDFSLESPTMVRRAPIYLSIHLSIHLSIYVSRYRGVDFALGHNDHPEM